MNSKRSARVALGVMAVMVVACERQAPSAPLDANGGVARLGEAAMLKNGRELRVTVTVTTEQIGRDGTVRSSTRPSELVVARVVNGGAESPQTSDVQKMVRQLARVGNVPHRAPRLTRFVDDNGNAADGYMQYANDGSPGRTVAVSRSGVVILSEADEWVSVPNGWLLKRRILTWSAGGLPTRRVITDVASVDGVANVSWATHLEDAAARILAYVRPTVANAAPVAPRADAVARSAARPIDAAAFGCWRNWVKYLGAAGSAEALCTTLNPGCILAVALVVAELDELLECMEAA